MSSLSPNDTFHLIGYVAETDSAALPLSGLMRSAFGGGLLLGVAPTSTQLIRLSAGGTLLLGQWGTDRLGNVSLEARLRASVNLEPTWIVPFDVYVEGVAPHFFASDTTLVGVGAGASTRVSSFVLELGLDFIFGNRDFGASTEPSPNALRGFLSVGWDLFASTGISQRATPHQTRVDLRCSVLATARKLAKQEYCGEVKKALIGAYAEPDHPAMARFLGALPQPLQNELKTLDGRYSQCLDVHRSLQRWCVDCTGETLSYWFTYTIDPHQVAAALGCIDGLRPEDALCASVDTQVAAEHDAECK